MDQQKIQIVKPQTVPIRDLWGKEDKDFTKWLEENLWGHSTYFDIFFFRARPAGRRRNCLPVSLSIPHTTHHFTRGSCCHLPPQYLKLRSIAPQKFRRVKSTLP